MSYKPRELALGIDLGTRNSVVSVILDGHAHVIPSRNGSRLVPSVVGFLTEGVLVGSAAKEILTKHPANVIFDSKRFIGRKWDDPEVKALLEQRSYNYNIQSTPDNTPCFSVPFPWGNEEFLPEEVSALVLQELKKMAEDYVGKHRVLEINKCVITVPANFDNNQRKATIRAANIAGLQVLQTLDEPTAAVIAYGHDINEEDKLILVFDLGGGTFDVSLVRVNSGGEYRVLITDGFTDLGGRDIDDRLVKLVKTVLSKGKPPADLSDRPKKFQLLLESCERAKNKLSELNSTNFSIVGVPWEGKEDSEMTSTSETFNALNSGVFQRTVDQVETLLRAKNVRPQDVDEVLLVGGTTPIPRIREMLNDFFGKSCYTKDDNPDEAVSIGAAIMAAKLVEPTDEIFKKLTLIRITPLNLGIMIKREVPEDSAAPTKIVDTIIPMSSEVPCKKCQTYTTSVDNQTVLAIRVYQGKRLLPAQNRMIGKFLLQGIIPRPAGVPNILVSFNLDENELLSITAKDVMEEDTDSPNSSNADEEGIAGVGNLVITLTQEIDEEHVRAMEKRITQINVIIEGKLASMGKKGKRENDSCSHEDVNVPADDVKLELN